MSGDSADETAPASRDENALRSLITSSGLPQRRVPPPQLRERILAAARADAFRFIGASAGLWIPLSPQARSKALFSDSSDRGSTRLLQLDHDAPIPEGAAGSTRSLFIVDGEVRLDGQALEPWDFVDGIGSASGGRAGRAGTLLLEMSPGGASQVCVSRSRSAPWFSPFPNGRVRQLREGRDNGHEVFVLEMAANSALDEHDHRGLEELFVLDGTCTIEGQPMAKGDYHRATAGSHHHATSTTDGCLLLVSVRAFDRVEASR
ncbi:MAG: cupin domain-containing protein [Gemmatimonadaceae bacterium]